MTAALEDASAGRGRFFLIAGESGVGKTRLADELASRAKEAGVHVLWGRSPKRGGAPPFWPWTQALRGLEVQLPPLDAAASETQQFTSFAELATGLRRESTAKPLLIVLDDLDRADEPSLLLLEFVAGELAEMHVAVVGTYAESSDMPAALRSLADHSAHHLLRLRPLGLDDVARFLELAGAAGFDAAAVHAETAGNPRLLWQRLR